MKKTDSHIVFTVCGQSFCLSVRYVKSILELPRVFTVPQAPPYIVGVVNVDGEVIPLINAGIKMNMRGIETKENATIIVLERIHQAKSQKLSLLIDEVQEVLDFNEPDLQPLPTSKFEFDERLVDGMYKTPTDFIMQINVENFFKHNLEEIASIAETINPTLS
jgi:purine-binding chemotaxis protein CheW